MSSCVFAALQITTPGAVHCMMPAELSRCAYTSWFPLRESIQPTIELPEVPTAVAEAAVIGKVRGRGAGRVFIETRGKRPVNETQGALPAADGNRASCCDEGAKIIAEDKNNKGDIVMEIMPQVRTPDG